MRWSLILVLIAGCAEANGVPPGDHDPGSGNGEAGTDTGVDGGTACNADQSTLNGTATYIDGSARAVDPAALTEAGSTVTCGDAIGFYDWKAAFSPAHVTNGAMGSVMPALVAGAPTASGCTYTLRLTTRQPPYPGCEMTADFALPIAR